MSEIKLCPHCVNRRCAYDILGHSRIVCDCTAFDEKAKECDGTNDLCEEYQNALDE